MNMTTKFILTFCIVVSLGYISPAQDSPSDNKVIMIFDGISFTDLETFREYLFKKNGYDPNRRGRILSKEEQLELGHPVKGSVRSSEIANFQYQSSDYSQLRYTIRMNRPGKYKLGEPIFICRYVKNMSDSNVFLRIPSQTYRFSADKVTLVDAEGNDVSMTFAGKREMKWIDSVKDKRSISIYTLGSSAGSLQPQVETIIDRSPIVLNHYFDLTRPGIYHLTFHRVTFCNAQEYDEPLASNTLTFEVLDEFVTPDDLRDPGEFNWPPPDEPVAAKPPDAATPPAE